MALRFPKPTPAGQPAKVGKLFSGIIKNSPTRQYEAKAEAYGRTATQNVYNQLGKMTGNELIGTPGFLANQVTSPGSYQRMRARALRAAAARGADVQGELETGLAGKKLDFAGDIIKMNYQKKLAGGGGPGSVLGKIAGAGLGFLTGGPMGAVSSAIGGVGTYPSGAYTPRAPYVSTAEDTYLRRRF